MESNKLSQMKAKLHSELQGTPEQNRAVLEAWAERCRGKEEFQPLLKEIGRLLFALDAEENSLLTQRVLAAALENAQRAYAAAQELIKRGAYHDALETLAPVVESISGYAPSDGCVWMDFYRMLDGLLYQDYFGRELNGREILRHPMQPGKYLYTYGSLLIQVGRAGDAAAPLEQLAALDPVCPEYLFELAEAYKRTNRIQDAYNASAWALSCASNDEHLARCYRNMAFCLSESGQYEDAALLCQLSLRFQASPIAEEELAWIGAKTGTPPKTYTDSELTAQCEQRGYPVGLSRTVVENLRLLNSISG